MPVVFLFFKKEKWKASVVILLIFGGKSTGFCTKIDDCYKGILIDFLLDLW